MEVRPRCSGMYYVTLYFYEKKEYNETWLEYFENTGWNYGEKHKNSYVCYIQQKLENLL